MASEAEIRWAQKYNGWARFAGNHDAYLRLLGPTLREFESTGRVPEWCGVDLLRAWAFLRQREHYNAGGGPMARDWDAVLDALRKHPYATGGDLPPLRETESDDRRRSEPATDWDSLIRAESAEPYWAVLQEFVAEERDRGPVYPPARDVFRALELTPYDQVKAVIVGQDPYHGPGEAHGLCFSVPSGVAVPPSLRTIFKVLRSDLGIAPPDHGSLEHWARQGVLLLNTALTVRHREPASHAGRGWERFTDAVLSAVAAKQERVVFILWGDKARRKQKLIPDRHGVVEAPHPASRQAAHREFLASKPFSTTNLLLAEAGRQPIDWRIPDA